ncbi:hypothetical protein P8Q88_01025 [Qipengyuania sp. XHP0207]|uniref:ATP-grasp domain-containing protein n=1 Tax=Qipengyuania sp. XHP0207 TaxID=3038078 RepID=UPI00241E5A4B|nr:hypothetical protein [Qipengyuania sp. XHP0207]MDG5746752.1 hypothetical protein [Qipengyuania sp. XHP0207]
MDHFDGLALVLLGTAWDYQDHPAEFLDKLETLHTRDIAVCNPPEIVRWNADKGYLRELEEAGATIVPTAYFMDADAGDVGAAMDMFDTPSVVVKRRIGAGGLGQFRFTADAMPAPDWRMGHRCLIQPFLPSVIEEGEYTFLFIDGEFSHGVLKRAAAGEYRIQSLFGGYETDFTPCADDLATARSVVAALPFATPLYCRIDMARLPSGALAVMEAELIEPYLYPEQGPQLGARLAAAIRKRLD